MSPAAAAPKSHDKSHDGINDLVATLAARQKNKDPGRPLRGPERAAVLMLALGDQYGDQV